MPITIYGVDHQSTKKAKKWFFKYEIPFVERNLLKEPITKSELKMILQLSLNGTDDIIATRTNTYRNLKVNIDELPLGELHDLIVQQPRLLKSPIITDGIKLQIGYQEEGIRQFLPRKHRKNWLQLRLHQLHLQEN